MSTDPRLHKAKELIRRLKCREFYDFIGEILIPSGSNFKGFSEKDII
jgi:hypothetical protein